MSRITVHLLNLPEKHSQLTSTDGFDNPPHLSQNPVSRAAGITRAAMIFRQQLKRGLIEPDATKEGPLCMDSYR